MHDSLLMEMNGTEIEAIRSKMTSHTRQLKLLIAIGGDHDSEACVKEEACLPNLKPRKAFSTTGLCLELEGKDKYEIAVMTNKILQT